MKRKLWFSLLLLAPLVVAIPLWFAASWRPREFGVHPIRGQSLPPFVPGAMATPPQYRLMMAPDGAHLLSLSTASKPYGMAMWDVKRKVVVWKTLQTGHKNWSPLCFSRDGKTLAMTENLNFDVPNFDDVNPTLALFDVATGKQTAVLPVGGHVTYFADAVFSPDNTQLVAAGNEVRTWDVATRREISRRVLTTKAKNASASVALAPDGTRFIVDWVTLDNASVPHYVGAELRDASSHVQWKMPTGVSPRFDFSPDGTKILSSDQSSLFEMRDVQTGRVLWKKIVLDAGFNGRAWLPDSSAIAMSMNGKIEMWDAGTGAVMRSIACGQMQNFVVAPDGSQLYMIDFAGKIWSQRLR